MSLAAFGLDGRVAVVTGAAQGIGFEIARALVDSGAAAIVADRNAELGARAAAELGATFEQPDVTDPAGVRELARRLLGTHGRVDILVNNAGIVFNTPAETTPDEQWHSVMAVNLDGVFWCCREFGALMLKRGSGSIVNIASMSGMISNHPQPQASYNVSKAGVIMLTRSLAGEWASRGVRVNAVAPGYTATPLVEQVGLRAPGWRDIWLAGTPMGRMALPAEIAPAVVYLASDASSFVTGSTLVVDGGYTAW